MSLLLPRRNVGIIAHIDAGKTTLSERILYYAHREHQMGEVDTGTATLDWMPEEQERGITITAAATTVEWRGHRIQLIDTPGHVDFTAEVERSLRVLDGAVGLFCGTAGVQAQSETVWRQADRHRVPRLAFVNKLDRTGADFQRVVEGIRSRLHVNAVPLQMPIGRERAFEGVVDLLERRSLRFAEETLGERVDSEPVASELRDEAEAWRTRLIEAVCEFDDTLLEQYLAGVEIPTDRIKAAIRRATLERRMVPVLGGAALRNRGVQPLLDAICDYLPGPGETGAILGTDPATGQLVEVQPTAAGPLVALAFKTVADPHGDLVYLRLYRGRLEDGMVVWSSRNDRRDRAQKLYRMHANHREHVAAAVAGDIVAAVGLKETSTGDTLTDPAHKLWLEPPRFPEAVVTVAVEPVSTADRDKLLASLDRLVREDPTLRWRLEKETGQVVLSGMGELHLDIVKERLRREFKVEAAVGPARVAYRQTVARGATFLARFERAAGERHLFAAVEVRLEPAPEVGQREVRHELPKGTVPQELVATIVDATREALEGGGSLGFPLVQVRATIQRAEHRPQESTPAAFQAAAALAVQGALSQAGLVLLEPVMRFEVQVPDACYGPVSSDLERRRARLEGTQLVEGLRVLQGRVPLGEVFGYPGVLRSLTQGRGSLSLEPDAYQPVPAAVQARFGI